MTSEEVLRLIEQEKQQQTGKLNLFFQYLREVPKELLEIPNLQALKLTGNKISDYSFLEKLSNLHTLNLRFNQISDISFLGKLPNLQTLDLSANQISDYSFLGELPNLHTLNLNANQISDISFLGKLPNLHTLNLSDNLISDYSFFWELPNLHTLDLSYNKISDYSFLEKLSNLHTLVLRNIKVSNISFLGELSNLHTLDLSDNLISDISFLEKLTNLHTLDLSANQVSDISFFNQLAINENGLIKLLDISNNNIKDLTPVLPLIERGFPVKWGYFEDGLCVKDNPLEKPPIEIIKQGNQSILDWFAANKKALKEIKVILIGKGKAGKTSLLRRLKDGDYKENEQQTDGINIESIDFETHQTFQEQQALHDLTGHFWDFGGQEIMNATHQFFLTKRSVYILVLDARTDNSVSAQIRDWIKRIKSTGGNSSIIVVANKIDLNPGFGFDNKAKLQAEFPQIKAFVTASCQDNTNLDTIKNLLAEWIPKAELFHTEIDERWIDIKEQLQIETTTKHNLNEERFIEICEQHQLHDEASQRNVIRFLHDLGLVMHFEGKLSSAYFVLDPYWITYGVYQIVTSNYAASKKGNISIEKLNFIINKEADKKEAYKPKKHRKIKYDRFQRLFLIDVLCQFKLCFYLQDEKHFILPNLLNTDEPTIAIDTIQQSSSKIEFVYAYEYLPKSVMPFIMVEKFKNITEMWRTGCIVTLNSCRGLISSYGNELTLVVIGQHKQKRDFMSRLRYGIDKINQQLNLEPEMLIPLPDGSDYVDYEELLEMEADNREFYIKYKPKRKFLISELLDGITNLSKEDKMIQRLVNIEKNASDTKKLVIKTITKPLSLQYPNVFTLGHVYSKEGSYSLYNFRLLCGHDGHKKKFGKQVVGAPYKIRINNQWITKGKSLLNTVIEYSKLTEPLIMCLSFLYTKGEAFKAEEIEGLKEYVNKFKVLEQSSDEESYKIKTADERMMEKIKAILEKKDKNRNWRDLLELKTKDGECFWVCPICAKEYD